MTTIEVVVPDLGEYSDVPVIEILISPGDEVAEDDSLIAIESEKATMEIPSPVAGRVTDLFVNIGDLVSTGTLILKIETAGAAPNMPSLTVVETAAETAPSPMSAVPGEKPQGEVEMKGEAAPIGAFGPLAGPSVRRLARELDIDLATVTGTGDHGRVTKDDVKAYLTGSTAVGSAGGMGIPPIPTIDFSKFGPVEVVEMPRVKKISGPVLHRSWLNVPHVTHHDEADITELDAYRKLMDDEAKSAGYRVTLLSFLIKIAATALREHWEVNSSLAPSGGALIRKNYYNVAFAADTPNGLVVPVIKHVDKKGIVDISKELGELSARAREGKLRLQDMEGGTFTISSLGGIGGTGFTPIVNAPEVAILGVSRAKLIPVWNGTEFVPRNMLPLSLSYDHRAIDGALAARFLVTMRNLLGDIRRLLN